MPYMTSVGKRAQLVRSLQREQILDAVARLVASKGFAAVTMGGIATAAKVSKTTLYELYPSREAAYLGLLERTYGQLADGIEQARRDASPAGEWTQRVRQVVDAYLECVASLPDFVLAAVSDASALGSVAHDVQAAQMEFFIDLLQRLTDDLAASAQLPVLPEPLVLAAIGGVSALVDRAIPAGPEAIKAQAPFGAELIIRLLRGGSRQQTEV